MAARGRWWARVSASQQHSSLSSKCPYPYDSCYSFFPTPALPSSILRTTHYSLSPPRRRLPQLPALDSDAPHPRQHRGSVNLKKKSKSFEQWDSLTAKFSGVSNIPFMLIQMPQITLNARNLMAANKTALLAVPWLGMLTGLLGNLSLLSYFVNKREKEAIVVQALGVVSIYIVCSQLAIGEAMPLPQFVVTSVVVASGLVLNFLKYFGMLNTQIWHFWEDFVTVGGVSVVPQVMWSTFVPYVPDSILPGAVSSIIALAAVIMARTGKLPPKGVKFVGSISGWTATLLFMWMPVSQMWTNLLNPDNIKGLSAFSKLFGMIGNGLMMPRALFIRDLMWFTGATWAALFYGYGNILCMYCFNTVNREFFWAATVGLISWLG
ncbi:hypothetical protein K2173_026468 [Erythroxylum novogranatense]|uniref:Maltose excess protein 1-like, chloroplastic n=1 Tax=Erythroxylum novogranatense TaxID=1862640 RepID=A0AAV8TWD1_9ROSI|nr:hypothetical protein K2173_026468 [Erythroxylum novogranatense]